MIHMLLTGCTDVVKRGHFLLRVDDGDVGFLKG
jgi:hypothetical protein